MTEIYRRIYEAVKQIPRGRVATYGQIAAIAGNKNWARLVGNALHANDDPEGVPCYRVVNSRRAVAEAFVFGGGNRQRELLKADGIEFDENGRVPLEKYMM